MAEDAGGQNHNLIDLTADSKDPDGGSDSLCFS